MQDNTIQYNVIQDKTRQNTTILDKQIQYNAI